ncbi:hypothetical protein ACQY0O_000361 [Thecaphora frezii]
MTIELEFSPINLLATGFGLVFILYGSVSYLFKERFFLGEAPIAVVVGIALGPYGLAGALGWCSKDSQSDELGLALARLVIGIQLTLVGVQLPYKYPWLELRSLTMLLLPVMTAMWLATTLCIFLAIPDLPLLAALAVSTGATPTDPVLSNAIVKGAFADQYVSPRIRNLLSAESGANDGFGYPFLYLAVHLIKLGSTSEALKTWALETCIYTVGGSIAYGTAVGYLCRKLLEFSTNKNWIDKESFLLYGAALGIFLVGSGGLLKLDDLLAAFVAGNALSWTDFYREQCEESEVDNCLDLLLNLVFFGFLGATIPWDAFNAPEYGVTPARLVGMCILVLLLRRMPAMLVFWRLVPSLHDVSEASFVGYFAPIGAGAFFYMEVILDEFKADAESHATRRILELVRPVTYALILASLIGHTLAIPLVKLYFDYRGIGSIKLYGETPSCASSTTSHEHDDGEEEATSATFEHSEPGSRVRRRHSVVGTSHYGGRRHSMPDGDAWIDEHGDHGRGAYRADGSWDNDASWRHSSGHKLASHQLSRREMAGAPLDVRGRDLEQGARQRSMSSDRRIARGAEQDDGAA